MTICITCGAELIVEPHTCADPLDGFDTDRNVFEPVRDGPVEVDDVSRRRWERAQQMQGPDLMDPHGLG